MVFLDFVSWVCMVIFLVGLVFILEATLSSTFGFIMLILACVYFSSYFWNVGMIIFVIMFVVVLILAVRFLISEINSNKTKWK